jgi:hypothetical protein
VNEALEKAEAPVWRRDDEKGQSYALKLTTAGLKAIAVDQDELQEAGGTKNNNKRSIVRMLRAYD